MILVDTVFHKFSLTSENIGLNRINNIELLMAGLAGREHTILLDREVLGNVGEELTELKNVFQILVWQINV